MNDKKDKRTGKFSYVRLKIEVEQFMPAISKVSGWWVM